MKLIPFLLCLFLWFPQAAPAATPMELFLECEKVCEQQQIPRLSLVVHLYEKELERQYSLKARDHADQMAQWLDQPDEAAKRKLLQEEDTLFQLQQQLEELNQLQQRLEQKLELADIIPGQVNEDFQLGTDGLPGIGGAHSSTRRNLQACLDAADLSNLYPSGTFLYPIAGGYVSAGTWAYPSGGVHVGMDIAAPMYSQLKAISNGLILYASAPVDSNCGYIGNYCGYPGGGGNTICQLALVGNEVFAISYFHLSNIHYVKTGQRVSQGDILALTGNSGNSSGPHTHIEIFRLKVNMEQAVAYFSATADFSWGCGWRTPGASSAWGTRIRPESVLL